MNILQSSNNPLFIIQLPIHSQFTSMSPWLNPYCYFESGGDGTEEFDTDAEADEGCHGAMGDGGCESNVNCGMVVVFRVVGWIV